jgi:uncharacterized protein (DUF1330 family)
MGMTDEEKKENELFTPAYFIARVNTADKAQYKQYIKVVPCTIAKYKGKNSYPHGRKYGVRRTRRTPKNCFH